MKTVNLQKLDELIRPVVDGQGYELVDLSFRREHGNWILQIMIDRRQGEGTISHQDCVSVSKEASVILDMNEQLLPVDYHLEVSSPGPNRPLRTAADFSRFVGLSAKVRLKEYAGRVVSDDSPPRRNFSGVIESVGNDVVTLKLSDGSPDAQLNLRDIEKAHLFGNDR